MEEEWKDIKGYEGPKMFMLRLGKQEEINVNN